ncbi:MAG: hypothetical protein Q4F95_06975 [Oscillospiraceae bacterium]|nr:hypothetical protein [Oscillospiraceae bacterium]
MPYRKKVILFFLSLTLSSQFIFVNETYAFQSSISQSAVNTFTSEKKSVSSDIDEPNGDSYNITSGKVSDKLIKIKNTSDVPVYVRVKISVCVKDTTSDLITDKPVVINGVSDDYCAALSFIINEAGGWKKSDDGFFYYTRALRPGESTTQLIEGTSGGEINISGLMNNEYISFTVLSETSQEAFYDK